jgi:chorismate mutase
MKTSPDAGIPGLRRAIDELDRRIVRLLAKRLALALQLAPLKRRMRDTKREQEVLAHVAGCARECGMDEALIRSMYRKVMAASRGCQRRYRADTL